MSYYSYMRISTESQADANGVQMQQKVISDYCKNNGIELSGCFEDEAKSGAKLEYKNSLDISVSGRAGFIDLLAILQKGDKVIVQNTSRLWRSQFDQVVVTKSLIDAGADVISIEQPTFSLYNQDANDFLINSIFQILDQYDKMMIATKLAKGRRAKAATGAKSCGCAPFGYVWVGREIEVDTEAAEVVKLIFSKYEELQNLRKVAEAINAEGYTSKRNNPFNKMSIKNILTNSFYKGVNTYAGASVEGVHTPIISAEQFDRVQALMQSRTNKKQVA